VQLRSVFRESLAEVGRAIRRPEELATRWRSGVNEERPHPMVFVALAASAIAGTAAWGLIAGLPDGPVEMLSGAFWFPVATGSAWLLAFPALYVGNAIFGARPSLETTALVALICMSFGALALIATIPIVWFFGLAAPDDSFRSVVNIGVFASVGIAMIDTFARVIQKLEPDRSPIYGFVWLGLVGCIGTELLVLSNAFGF